MARSGGARVLKIGIFVTSIGALGAGAWYLYGGQIRQFFQKEEPTSDDTDDDSDDDIEPDVEGGVRSGSGHRPGKRHGKAGRGGKGAAHAHVGGGGGGAGTGGGGNYGPAGKSYEAAIAGNHQQISMGAGNDGPDLTDAQLSAPLRHVSFLGTCGVPDSTHVTVKVAVRNGRAEGVSVYTSPPDPRAASCVDRSVRGLVWAVNPKLDSFVTTY